MKRWLLSCLFLLAALAGNAAPPAPARTAGSPRLVVLISIDQFRADYVDRFRDLFLPARRGEKVGGFRFLMEQGAQFVDAHHDHLPLATGPGHSVMLTGAPPYKSGIVGNDWYDRNLGYTYYCVEDPASPFVGIDPPKEDASGKHVVQGISPRTLLVTTVGDELKTATGGRAKVYGISLKDRASVLMTGHLADGAYWFDDATGRWITSRYYRKDGTLPAWVTDLNKARIPQGFTGKYWRPVVPATAFQRTTARDGADADAAESFGVRFPHAITDKTDKGKESYRAFTLTPYANEFVLQSAERLVEAEQLGWDATPDILAINLATNDYVGHAFGPNSREVLDVTVQTDRMLSRFLNDLAKKIPGGWDGITVALTADHGVAPNGEEARAAGLPGGRWSDKAALKAVDAALSKTYGEDHWAAAYREPSLWLDSAALVRKGVSRAQAEDVAAAALTQLSGVYAAYTRHRIMSGELPRTDIAHHVTLGFHPRLSGDVVIVSDPFWMAGTAKGTGHGEPYAYDTHVPLLLAGCGVRPGLYLQRVSTLDLAPSLSFMLRVAQPSGCEGHILPAIMREP